MLPNLNINVTSTQPPKEAIILAGGLGTRLRTAVPDLPKCMAPVAGKPFLFYVINHLRMQGIEKIIFSLGYLHHLIQDWLQEAFPTLLYDYVIEDEPLGTGGAIKLALQKANTNHVFIVNGDTMFKCNCNNLQRIHFDANSECTLALKPMLDFNRYGVVEVNNQHIINSFQEKKQYEAGLINAGMYLLNKKAFLNHSFPEKFSFEKDYLEKQVTKNVLSGMVEDAYFIDIGIPDDYHLAQKDFEKPPLPLSKIDKNWTLFLDRDGVINHDKPGGYITTAEEFQFAEGVPYLFQKLTRIFSRIIVVTNQRGVGRGIIAYKELLAMNEKMLQHIHDAGGKIEKIYFCTDVDDKSFGRKPNPGMAFQAIQDFPETDLNKSIMVGNSLSDMRFGRYAGMHTVFVTTTNKTISLPHPDIDMIFKDLNSFAETLI